MVRGSLIKELREGREVNPDLRAPAAALYVCYYTTPE